MRVATNAHKRFVMAAPFSSSTNVKDSDSTVAYFTFVEDSAMSAVPL